MWCLVYLETAISSSLSRLLKAKGLEVQITSDIDDLLDQLWYHGSEVACILIEARHLPGLDSFVDAILDWPEISRARLRLYHRVHRFRRSKYSSLRYLLYRSCRPRPVHLRSTPCCHALLGGERRHFSLRLDDLSSSIGCKRGSSIETTLEPVDRIEHLSGAIRRTPIPNGWRPETLVSAITSSYFLDPPALLVTL